MNRFAFMLVAVALVLGVSSCTDPAADGPPDQAGEPTAPADGELDPPADGTDPPADGDAGDDMNPDAADDGVSDGPEALLGRAEDLTPEARPERMLLTTADLRLVVVDTATGEEVRTLTELGEQPPEAPSSLAGAVTVPADGGLAVVVDVCCEPAAGSLVRIAWDEPTDDLYAEPFATALNIAAASDGRIAGIELEWLRLLAPDGTPLGQLPDSEALAEAGAPRATGVPAWHPDEHLLAVGYVAGSEGDPEPTPRIHLVEIDASGDLRDAGALDGTEGWSNPAFLADGTLVAAEIASEAPDAVEGTTVLHRIAADATIELVTIDGVVTVLRPDASGTNLLATLADGRVLVLGADGSIEPVGDGATSASWAPPGAS